MEGEHRYIEVGDAGSGADTPPPNEVRRIASVPVIETVQLLGGPLDGSLVQPLSPPTHDLELLRVVDEAGNPVDELYLARPYDGRWYGVHASLLQEVVRSDEVHIKEPDPGEMRARLQELFGADAKFAIEMCEPGAHDWSPWETTPRGNRHRICRICHTGQASYV